MLIRTGYELGYVFPQPAPLILTLHIHYSRALDLVRPGHVMRDPVVPTASYRDGFYNYFTRIASTLEIFRAWTEAVE